MSAFLKAGGVFDRLVESCPLRLTSPNAPTNRETLGTAIVGMLNGSSRYRHFDALAGDAVTAEAFGLRRLMSCDSVRRNLKAISEREGLEWIWDANLRLVEPLLDQDYVLDVGFGNEAVIACCEANRVPYLFKVRRTRLVKDLFRLRLASPSAWRDAGDGWQGVDTRLTLSGWSRQRRVLLMRRPVELKPRRRKDSPKRSFETILPGLELATANDDRYADGYEWHARVTDLGYDPRAVSRPCRERGDSDWSEAEIAVGRENVFDEMKSQLGWGGFVTRDMKRTAIAAGLSAFVAYAFRKYQLVQRLYPPLIGGQIMLPLS